MELVRQTSEVVINFNNAMIRRWGSYLRCITDARNSSTGWNVDGKIALFGTFGCAQTQDDFASNRRSYIFYEDYSTKVTYSKYIYNII